MTLRLRRKRRITRLIFLLRSVTGRKARWSAAVLGLLAVAAWITPLAAQESSGPSSRNAFETVKGPKRELKWQTRRPAQYRWKSASHRQVAHDELVFDAQANREPVATEPRVEMNAPLTEVAESDEPTADPAAPGSDPFDSSSPMPTETTPLEEPEMDVDVPPDTQIDTQRKEQDDRKRRAEERAESQSACKKAARDLKRIHSIDLNIKVSGRAGDDFPLECGADGKPFESRCWAETIYTWKPSSLCHKPLYFEEEALERYGHSKGPYLQPVYSAAHFFVTLPILPYKMGVQTPHECEYALGHYRPGSCAPYFIYPLPISVRGALFQAGAVVGTAAVLP
jgi:hypothetical protein